MVFSFPLLVKMLNVDHYYIHRKWRSRTTINCLLKQVFNANILFGNWLNT